MEAGMNDLKGTLVSNNWHSVPPSSREKVALVVSEVGEIR